MWSGYIEITGLNEGHQWSGSTSNGYYISDYMPQDRYKVVCHPSNYNSQTKTVDVYGYHEVKRVNFKAPYGIYGRVLDQGDPNTQWGYHEARACITHRNTSMPWKCRYCEEDGYYQLNVDSEGEGFYQVWAFAQRAGGEPETSAVYLLYI